MSVMNQSAEDQMECPLCMEPLEVDDLNFYPCTCGYQICRFCWNRIREGDSGLCPACRKAYPENPADFTPLSQEQVAAIKTEKKAREQKRRNKTLESRKALANVRVVQNNLVFVVGLPVRLADPETLKRQEYFGKYGKIHKVVINQSTTYAGSQGPSASAYVTYVTPADALRAIQGVNNVTLDGRILKASLGTTKYCAHFMKNQPCPKVDCMYLHDLGDSKASFSKEEMHAGLHQVYERKLHNQLLAASQPNSSGNSSSSSTDKGSSKDGNFIPSTVVTSSNITIVNSNKSSKKEPSSNGSSNCSSLSNGNKEAWPSLGSSPPNDSPHRKQPSPKLSVKSQENGARSSSESSSPTQPPTKTKHNKENHTDNKPNKSNKDNSTNNNKKSKAEKKQKNSKEKESEEKIVQTVSPRNELEELPPVKYLPNELEELESDRHSLLDESDHSLLDDDIHGLLEANSELMLIQRRNEMLSGLAENHLMQLKPTNIVNGFGLMNDRQININQSILEKEHRTEMMMRQNELLARQHAMVDPKHYLPSSSIALETNELLGANFHHNPNMLPPFGMRIDHSHSANPLSNSLSSKNLTANNLTGNPMGVNSLPMSVNGLGGNNMGVNSLLNANSMGMNTLVTNNMSLNPMSSNSLGVNSMGVNSLGANPMGVNSMNANSMGVNSLSSNHMGVNSLNANMGVKSSNSIGVNSMTNSMGVNSLGMSTMGVNSMGVSAMGVNSMSNGMGVNSLQGSGFMMPSPHMLQNRQQSGLVNGFDSPSTTEVRYGAANMDKFFTDFHKAQQLRQQSSGDRRHTHTHTPDWLDHEHKQRMNNNRVESSSHAAGDADDDLDFDPFKETQKAMAEMLESEMLENNVNHSENLERVRRLPPPGFSHMNAFGIGVPRTHTHVPSYSSQPPMYSDWTQMDPAIMSTSFSKPPHDLLSRLSHLTMRPPPPQPPQPGAWPPRAMPPGFSAAPTQQHPAECIDAK